MQPPLHAIPGERQLRIATVQVGKGQWSSGPLTFCGIRIPPLRGTGGVLLLPRMNKHELTFVRCSRTVLVRLPQGEQFVD